MSDAWSYWSSSSKISGALYYLEPIPGDRHLFLSAWFFLILRTFSEISNLICASFIYSIKFCENIEFLTLFVFPLPFAIQHSGSVLDISKLVNFTSQFSLIRIFSGLMSLNTILAEWINFMLLTRLNRIMIKCSSFRLRFKFDLIK